MTPVYAKILALLLSLPIWPEDAQHWDQKQAQLVTIADAVAAYAETPAEAALLLASGFEESGFSLRIHAGQCHPDECDHGRARGPWQLQRDGMSLESWDQMSGVENTPAQVRTAVKRLRFYREMCGDTPGTIARYFGLRCRERTPGVAHRFRTYRRFLDFLEEDHRAVSR